MLGKRELAFIDMYFICGLRGSDAARRVGSKQPRMYAHRMLSNVNVLAEIDKRLARNRMSANMVLFRLSEMAMSNIADFADCKTSDDLKRYRHKSHVIKKFKTHTSTIHTKDGSTIINTELELELYGADSALVNVGRHYKLFTDNFKIEDWRTELLDKLKSGEIKPEQAIEIIGDDDLCKELFERAGLQFAGIRETQTQSIQVE